MLCYFTSWNLILCEGFLLIKNVVFSFFFSHSQHYNDLVYLENKYDSSYFFGLSKQIM